MSNDRKTEWIIRERWDIGNVMVTISSPDDNPTKRVLSIRKTFTPKDGNPNDKFPTKQGLSIPSLEVLQSLIPVLKEAEKILSAPPRGVSDRDEEEEI